MVWSLLLPRDKWSMACLSLTWCGYPCICSKPLKAHLPKRHQFVRAGAILYLGVRTRWLGLRPAHLAVFKCPRGIGEGHINLLDAIVRNEQEAQGRSHGKPVLMREGKEAGKAHMVLSQPQG